MSGVELTRAIRHAQAALVTAEASTVEVDTDLLGVLIAALSNPPAEDLRELIDHLNGLMDSLDESVSTLQVYEQLRVAWNMARALRPGVATPPADDVREALTLEEVYEVVIEDHGVQALVEHARQQAAYCCQHVRRRGVRVVPVLRRRMVRIGSGRDARTPERRGAVARGGRRAQPPRRRSASLCRRGPPARDGHRHRPHRRLA